MGYKPGVRNAAILERAWNYVQGVNYRVTVRWVFYRLLQDGTYNKKSDYGPLKSILSSARKQFYEGWRPDTLADDTRSPILMQRTGYYTFHLRGGHGSFKDEKDWIEKVMKELNCPLDRWETQPQYLEVWFEAAAMQSQFLYHLDPNVPLLAFHGDITIDPKWNCATRLVKRWQELRKPITVLYYGDLDDKGRSIPKSAEKDIRYFASVYLLTEAKKNGDADWKRAHLKFQSDFTFIRVGLTEDQVTLYNIPENPEHPGTYQWEGLDDDAARELISEANRLLDFDAFDAVQAKEDEIQERFRRHMQQLMDDDDATH